MNKPVVQPRITLNSRSRVLAGAACLLLFAAGSGCTNVSVMQQRLVSKPNMTFSDSLVFDYGAGIHPRIEPGTAGSGGAQASGCTSCK